MEADVITLQDIFKYQLEAVGAGSEDRRRLRADAASGPASMRKFAKHGIELPTELFGPQPLGRESDGGDERSSACFDLAAARGATAARGGARRPERRPSADAAREGPVPRPRIRARDTNGAALAARPCRSTENGRAVASASIVRPARRRTRTFGVVLVIDASTSMQGADRRKAMAAARRSPARSPAPRRSGW